jgi:hypothetical protein
MTGKGRKKRENSAKSKYVGMSAVAVDNELITYFTGNETYYEENVGLNFRSQ